MILFSYILFIVVAIGIWVVDYFRYKRAWYSPLYLFIISMTAYISPLTLRYIYNLPIEGNVTPFFYELRDIYPFSLLITTLSMIVMYVTYLLTPRIGLIKFIQHRSQQREVLGKFNLRPAAFICLFSGVILLFFLAKSYGGILAVALMGYGVTFIFSEAPLLALSISIIITSAFLFLAQYSISKKRADLFLSLIIMVVIVLFQIILGRRSIILSWGLSYLIFYSVIIHRLSFKKIFPLIVLGFLFLNLLGFVRKANYDNIDAFIDSAQIQIENLSGNREGLFYTLSTGQFVVPYETLPMLMEKISPSEYRYGSTLLEPFIQWVPRFIYSEKDYGIAEWYYHRFYDPSAPPNEGRQFFFLTEGYLNFGMIGVLIFGGLWGFFWKSIAYLSENPASSKPTILTTFIFSIYSGAMIVIIAGSSVSIFTTIIKSNLLWFLIAYLFTTISVRIRIG